MKTIKYLFAILFSLAVVACGSSGGDGSSTTSTPPPTYSISGTVSDPMGVTITVTGGTANTGAITDASGKYTVTGLNDGTYTVTPSKPGYTFTPLNKVIVISGANMTVPNFTGGNAVHADVSGTVTVTGAWFSGVTITMSNGAIGTTSTDAGGNYSFPGLASGVTYTFTPTLAGYTFTPASSTVAIPQASSVPITVQPMSAASTIASYSISGKVSKTTAKTGTIGIRLIPCDGCSSVLGTVADSSGTYTVRGLQPGKYTVVAEMDALGTVSPNATNPIGKSSSVTISADNPNPTVNVTVADPSPVPAPRVPVLLHVAPGDSSALVMYSPPEDYSGQEYATSYKIYWTDAATSTVGGSATFAAQGDRNNHFYFVSDPSLTNGVAFNFRMTALIGTTENNAHNNTNMIGPVTIGVSTAGTNTVSGAVTFPGAATGTMIVGLYSGTTGIYFTRIPITTNTQNYTIAGVADGSYFPFAVIDTNSNGAIDIGEISNINAIGGLITVAGGTTTNSNLTLSAASATADVNTEHYWDGGSNTYRLLLGVNDGTKRAVAVTLVSGANVAVPVDMSANRVISLITTRPNTGDSYMFKVTFSDGSTENISGNVTGVLDSFATNLATVTDGTSGSSATVPLFTWADPTTPPASYTYSMVLWGVTASDSTYWSYPRDFGLPSITHSALYNVDGRASFGSILAGPLKPGNSYGWAVQVRDANGNSAWRRASGSYVP